jgi:hypothetical protein
VIDSVPLGDWYWPVAVYSPSVYVVLDPLLESDPLVVSEPLAVPPPVAVAHPAMVPASERAPIVAAATRSRGALVMREILPDGWLSVQQSRPSYVFALLDLTTSQGARSVFRPRKFSTNGWTLVSS